MIIYDKKGNFIGMSQNALSTLGFQDLDEFKSSYTDLADMFVENLGYISKFKNFSWVNYALHSGSGNRKIRIRKKNGKEVEAKFRIIEILMMKSSNDDEGLYNIEIDFAQGTNGLNQKSNSYPSDDLEITSKNSQTSNDTDTIYNKTEESESVLENNKLDSNSLPIDSFDDIYDNDFAIDDSDKININLDVDEDGIESDFIIKDNTQATALDSNSLTIDSFDDDFIIDDSDKININLDAYEDGIESDFIIKDDTQATTSDNFILKEDTKQQELIENSNNEKEIDLMQMAEDTGIGLDSLAKFINDFITESKKVLEFIKVEENANDITLAKDKIIILKGVATQLKIYSIIKTLDQIISSNNSLEFKNKLDFFNSELKSLEKSIF